MVLLGDFTCDRATVAAGLGPGFTVMDGVSDHNLVRADAVV